MCGGVQLRHGLGEREGWSSDNWKRWTGQRAEAHLESLGDRQQGGRRQGRVAFSGVLQGWREGHETVAGRSLLTSENCSVFRSGQFRAGGCIVNIRVLCSVEMFSGQRKKQGGKWAGEESVFHFLGFGGGAETEHAPWG